jgi:alanine-synthesizing transaminase
VFSSRVPVDRSTNRLHRAIERLRSSGTDLIDLTLSNPTSAGIPYPPNLLSPLASGNGLLFQPAPFGLPAAREAVARSLNAGADQILLTASTSEAYSLLFKLLCDPGDTILAPTPSYPLLEFLAPLDAVRAIPWRLDYHGVWSIDVESIRVAADARTRAIVVVNPNNPTGSYVKRSELDALSAFCAERGIAIIGDEVFYDFPLGERPRDAVRVIDQSDALAFSLGGLSKSAGLPQLKLGWIAVTGPGPLVNGALERLEIIADTYLSVATPVQLAAPALIEAGARIRAGILERLRANATTLAREAARHPSVRPLPIEGGWYGVLQIPSIEPEEDLVVDLLERDHVIVHPGYFFDFPRDGHLVVSLLPQQELFADGVSRTIARASADARV